MSSVRYVPILKGRAGEYNALGDFALATRKNVYPLVEVLPHADPDKQDVIDDCDRAMKKLEMRWRQRVMLDVGYFDLDVPGGGPTPLRVLMDRARDTVEGVPVLRLSDNVSVRIDAADVAAKDQRGIAIRIIGEDLDEDPEDLTTMIADLASEVGVALEDIDLVLDLGSVQGDVAVVGGARLVLSLLRGMADIDRYRSVTVASGAFPADLSGITPWTLGEHPRQDAALWNRVTAKTLRRVPDYGDYAIAHPALVTGVPVSPPPQLRYTVADRWLVMKARRNDPRGHAQFYDICDHIASHPDFAGAGLGKADARIASSRGDGTGNATTWRTIGTTHHADYVVQRLTTLGEP